MGSSTEKWEGSSLPFNVLVQWTWLRHLEEQVVCLQMWAVHWVFMPRLPRPEDTGFMPLISRGKTSGQGQWDGSGWEGTCCQAWRPECSIPGITVAERQPSSMSHPLATCMCAPCTPSTNINIKKTLNFIKHLHSSTKVFKELILMSRFWNLS